MCKVSIIVPLYNGEKTIARCLKSLIRQELRDIEILVVDDGSTDGGAAVVRTFMDKDARIRLITQENQGQGAARNAGIRQAVGTYVGFVDCDDFVRPDMYRIMTEALEHTKAQAAVCQEKNVYEKDGKFQLLGETRFQTERVITVSGETVLNWQMNYRYLSLNSMCYKVAERALLAADESLRFPEQKRYAEDLVMSIGVHAGAARVAVIPQSLYYYVHSGESFTYHYSLKHARDIYLDWQDALAYLKRGKISMNTDNFSLGMYFNSLKQMYWTKEPGADTGEARALLLDWDETRRAQKWKPRFRGAHMPWMHKIKVCTAYFRLIRPMSAAIHKMKWIPLFRYL